MRKTLNFGVLGCGLAAEFHAAAIAATPGANLIGVCDSDPGAIPPQAHIGVIRDFCEAVRDGRPPISDLADGINALALIRAIYDSAESGRRAEPGKY